MQRDTPVRHQRPRQTSPTVGAAVDEGKTTAFAGVGMRLQHPSLDGDDVEVSPSGDFRFQLPFAAASSRNGTPSSPTLGQSRTPRGCRFPSLDAAHRNITGRSASSSSSAHIRARSSSIDSTGNESPSIGFGIRTFTRKDSATCLQDDFTSSASGHLEIEPAHGPIDSPRDIPLQDLSHTGVRLSTVAESVPEPASPAQQLSPDPDGEGPPRTESPTSLSDASTRSRLSDTAKVNHFVLPGCRPNPPIPMSEDCSAGTVDQIYEQYSHAALDEASSSATVEHNPLAAQPSFPQSSSHEKLSPADLSELRARAAARCGFRSDDRAESFDFSQHDNPFSSSQDALVDSGVSGAEPVASRLHWHAAISPGEAPPFSLPRIPTGTVSDLEGFLGSPRTGSFHLSITASLTDSQGLLNGGLGSASSVGGGSHTELYPLPLVVQAKPTNKSPIRKSYLSAGATSVGTTTESDDDPFKYDKGSYGVFMVPRKEREVSAALHRIGTAGRDRKTTPGSPDRRSPLRHAFRPPPIPEGRIAHVVERIEHARSEKSRLAALTFLDPAAVKSAWELDETSCTVKVPVLPPPGATGWKAPVQQELLEKPHMLTEKKLKGVLGEQQGDAASVACASDRDEWETVPTARGALDSIGVSFSRRMTSKAGGEGGGFVKTTGSSIADISDEDSSIWQAAPLDEFSSTDRIIQHPTKDGTRRENFRIRHLKDSDMPIPVFVPKQRVHRVNGFAQDAIRMIADADTDAVKKAMGRGNLSFSLLGKKKAPRPGDRVDDDRFRFRDTMCTSGSKGDLEGDTTEQVLANHRQAAERPDRSCERGEALERRESDAGVGRASADHDASISSADTSHNFSFPLIPLPEAARLQAVRRASGQEDHSDADFDRVRQRASIRSSKKTKGSTFVTARLPRVPENVHRRVPTPLYAPDMRPSSRDTDAAQPSSPLSSGFDSSSPERRTWRSIFDGSTAAFGSSPTRDRKGRFGGRGRQYRCSGAPDTPHLYPWDRRRPRQGQSGSDPSLRAVADMGLAQGSLPLTYMSHEGRRKQRGWFAMMVALSIFPFLSVLIYFGQFDSALSWYTRGEVHRLTRCQRRVILVMMVLQFFIWPPVIVLAVKKVGGSL